MTISIVEDVAMLNDLYNIGHRRGCTEGTRHVMRGPTAGSLLSPSCTGPVGKQYQHTHLFTVHLSSSCFIRVGLHIRFSRERRYTNVNGENRVFSVYICLYLLSTSVSRQMICIHFTTGISWRMRTPPWAENDVVTVSSFPADFVRTRIQR
ncbi:hypothetical protein BJV77DRAFT_547905 [Russula vinacea]|nr:hypothetical protein BJV77DRAFT_547905 [Russula vinacea]